MAEERDAAILKALGTVVTVTIDRPLGTSHPKHPSIVYPINYGYIHGVLAPDGDWQDAYVLGGYLDEKIEAMVHFQEQFFDSKIYMNIKYCGR